jgi:hypothetical protein
MTTFSSFNELAASTVNSPYDAVLPQAEIRKLLDVMGNEPLSDTPLSSAEVNALLDVMTQGKPDSESNTTKNSTDDDRRWEAQRKVLGHLNNAIANMGEAIKQDMQNIRSEIRTAIAQHETAKHNS